MRLCSVYSAVRPRCSECFSICCVSVSRMPAVISFVVLEMLHCSTRNGSLCCVLGSSGASGIERLIG